MTGRALLPRCGDNKTAIICALRLEFDAVTLAFDEIWDKEKKGTAPKGTVLSDDTIYTVGRIQGHDVVLVLVSKRFESSSAVQYLQQSFPGVNLAILTGICRGAPRKIKLGDVVVSQRTLWHDRSFRNPERHVLTGNFAWISDLDGRKFPFTPMEEYQNVTLQHRADEILEHIQQSSADKQEQQYFDRPLLKKSDGEEDASQFEVRFGCVGSGDMAINSSVGFNSLAIDYESYALGVPGLKLSNQLPCVIIKGVCDYVSGDYYRARHSDPEVRERDWNGFDLTRGRSWHRFAAATAASTTVAFLSLFESTSRPATLPTFIVPSSRNPDFIGRTTILDEIRQLLGHKQGHQIVSKEPRRVALYGPHGVGKSEIALEYLWWLRSARPDVSVFWVNASSEAAYHESYKRIAIKLKIYGFHGDTDHLPSVVNTWLEAEHQQWLIVIDDVKDAQLPLPKQSDGSILITTRHKSIASWFVSENRLIALSEMSEGEAQQLLQDFTCDKVSTEDTHFLSVLVDHSTSQLLQIALFLRKTKRSIGECLQLLDQINHIQPGRMRHVTATELEMFADHMDLVAWKNSYSGAQTEAFNADLSDTESDDSSFTVRPISSKKLASSKPPSVDGDDEVQSLASLLDSSVATSRIFSDILASTKPSSLESDVNRVEEADITKPKAENFYSHQEENLHSSDEHDEIQSLISGVEDIQSQDGSGSVSWGIREAAVSYLAEMLASDPILAPLYKSAAQRLEGQRFVRNHGRLLKGYYMSLRAQASSQKQEAAIGFLRPRAHRALISIKIRENMEFLDTKREKVNVKLPQDERRDLTLNSYLSGLGTFPKSQAINNTKVTSQAVEKSKEERDEDELGEGELGEDELGDGELGDDEQSEYAQSEGDMSEVGEEEWDEYQEECGNGAGLASLEETRSFFVSGRPLADFGTSFQNFLDPTTGLVEETQQKDTRMERSSVVPRGAALLARLYDTWVPPKPGLERVRYICVGNVLLTELQRLMPVVQECGEYTFLDVRELDPGGVERFRQRLARNGLANVVMAQDPTEVRIGLQPPQPVYLGSERSQSMSTHSSRSRSSSSRSSLSTPPSSLSEEETLRQNEETTPQYLLLCINQKRLSELVQIDCRPYKNDQYLCQQILKQYQITRAKATWSPSLLLPLSVLGTLSRMSVFLEQKTSTWLGWIFQFFRSFSQTTFFEMDTGDFVRFQLVPVGLAAVPTHFKCAEFPPESEVKAGKYLYEPVPMIDVAPASIPLWHLTKPGPHSDMYWIRTFPKKLGYKLDRRPGDRDPAIGWGIRVNESFNWRHFLFLILTFSISISIIVGIYVAVTSDASSAFGLGAFLAALVAIYIPHQYFAWKEKIS